MRGRAKVFGGEWVVRSAGLTHIRRSSTRARVLLYIRPPCPRREIAAMGSKDAPCEYPSPAKAYAPAPSAFALPCPRSHFPRIAFHFPPRSNRHLAAVVIHNGLSTEKLSTSLPAALCKTFSPSRLRTRIYNISFARRPLPGSVRAAPEKSPRRCATVSRAAVRRVGEGEGKGGRPLAQCRTMPLVCRITVRKGGSAPGKPRPCPCVLPAATCLRPRPRLLMGKALCAKAEVHKANPPLPVRSPRDSLSTAAPLPVDGRTAVRRVGEGEGKGPLAQQPAPVCLPPRPRRLNGHPASAGGRENDRMAHRRTTTPTHRTQRGNDTCTIRVPRHKGAQSVVHNLYFSSSRPASFCTTFPQSCTDRPATYRKEHKWPPEGLIFRVLPPAFPPFPRKPSCKTPPHRPRSPPEKRPASRLRETALAPSRPRNATTRHDLRILHVFSEIRTNRQPAEN